jgi:transaldolase/glucose-6-phosphate isomerase
MPSQAIFSGQLESAYRRELQRLIARKGLERLWAKDASLWTGEGREAEFIHGSLHWLDLPERFGPLMARVAARAAEIEPAGFEDVVFVALGTSSVAAEAVLKVPSAKLGKRTFLLNSIDPDAVRALEANLRLEKTLFIFPSKFGKDIDAHSLFLYFLEQLRVRGSPSPSGHFIALAEENSYLGQLAGEYQFADRFFDPPGILGRYSALIHFNFFVSALCRVDPADLLARTRSMRDACQASAPAEANPALQLAAVLAAAQLEQQDRLVFLCSENLQALARRFGELVGASTSKDGRGIMPLFGRASALIELIKSNCLSVYIKMGREKDKQLEEHRDKLRVAGTPLVIVELSGPEEFAAEGFKWEIATALACSLLETNPFRPPAVREIRSRSAEILEQLGREEQGFPSNARVRDAGIELYAEGDTRRELSTLNLLEALRSFLALRRPNGYLALLPFMDLNATRMHLLERIREQCESRVGLPMLITPGPQYLHTISQVYSDGPAKGLLMIVTANPRKDLPVPGADYTFGQIQAALAQADFESLGRKGKPVIRLHLTGGADLGLVELGTVLGHLPAKRDSAMH